MNTIEFTDANSRDTYFSLHNIRNAHRLSLGEGVKVGVIDWLFAMDEHPGLYAGFADITGAPEQLQMSGHGEWMAVTLREIAPKCKIFAINAITYGVESDRADLLVKAVEWAIENEIEILTYSHAAFFGSEKAIVSKALKAASAAGIITTFIHCDSPHNIFPYACYPFKQTADFERRPDVNILHYDYNHLLTNVYERYRALLMEKKPIQSGDDIPHFSFSSMSAVLGGFAALLKCVKRDLSAGECRRILIETSYEIPAKGVNWYDVGECDRVVDIGKAVAALST